MPFWTRKYIQFSFQVDINILGQEIKILIFPNDKLLIRIIFFWDLKGMFISCDLIR